MNNTNSIIGVSIMLGGGMGYIKKGSLHSIISGSLIGGIYLLSSYLVQSRQDDLGYKVAFTMSTVTAALMLPRLIQTKKLFPSGFVLLLAILGLLHNGKQLKYM